MWSSRIDFNFTNISENVLIKSGTQKRNDAFAPYIDLNLKKLKKEL